MVDEKSMKKSEKKSEEVSEQKIKEEQNLVHEVKYRINLSLPLDHPFAKIQNDLKKRGVKNMDLNALLLDVFEQVPQTWWQEKVELLTPLEHKINAALLDPDMRKKISALLESRQ